MPPIFRYCNRFFCYNMCITQTRRQYRPLRRRPLGVTRIEFDPRKNGGDVENLNSEYEANNASKIIGRAPTVNFIEPIKEESDGFTLPDGVSFVKLHEGDKRFGPAVMAAKHKKRREKDGIILLEGARLIQDAIGAGIEVKSIYFTRLQLLENLGINKSMNIDLYKVLNSNMKIWSEVDTPPGIMAICKKPKFKEHLKESCLPLTIILDNIRTPGNMGTILRSAAAVGSKKILIMKGCVDVWDPKVLRAAAGAHFHCHILSNIQWHLINSYLSNETNIYLADNKTNNQSSEADILPNVLRQVTENTHEVFREQDVETGQVHIIDEGYMDEELLNACQKFPLHTNSCYDVNFTKDDVTLVIGGETHGLSGAAHKLAFDRNGEKIYIPMLKSIESLNASVAASVLMFEIQRQILNSR